MDFYQKHAANPRKDLRFKTPVDPFQTDREIFANMTNTDLWLDADLPSVLLYLANNKHLAIPSSWQRTMGDYIREVREAAPHLI